MKTVELSELKTGVNLKVSSKGYAKIKYLLNGKKVKPIWIRDVGFCTPPVEVFYIKQLDKLLYVYNCLDSGTSIKLLNS